MDRLKLGILFWALLALGFSLPLVAGQDSDEEVAPDQPVRVEKEIFHPPARLMAADGVIDSGLSLGHSSPWVVDLDGDGVNDLVVGDFSGKFRFYRNEGTNKRPIYAKAIPLQAGGVDAQVPIY
jgi:hypothetical protein